MSVMTIRAFEIIEHGRGVVTVGGKRNGLGWMAVGIIICVGSAMAEEKASPAEKKAPAAAFIGTSKCKMCHKPQFESWGKTSHAKSLEALEKATPEQIAKAAEKLGVAVEGKASEQHACLVCHVTGLHGLGGYTAEKGKKDMLDSVSCEACHGAGSFHMKAKREDKPKTINGRPGEVQCLVCHTKAMSPEFKFEAYVKKGVHESFKKPK